MATDQSSSPPNPADDEPQNQDNILQPKTDDVQQKENTEDDNKGITEQKDPPPSAPKTSTNKDGTKKPQQIRLYWYHWVIAVIVLAVLGYCLRLGFTAFTRTAGFTAFTGTAGVAALNKVRNFLSGEKTNHEKPSLAEETSAAAKAAATTATDVAKASHEMLLSFKNEEKRYFEEFVNHLEVQVKEMKSMSVAIRKLEEAMTSILALEVRAMANKAIQASTKNEVDVHDLCDVVMQISDFDYDTLNSVIDYLVQNDKLAMAFMARNLDQRKRWIEKFIKEHGGASM